MTRDPSSKRALHQCGSTPRKVQKDEILEVLASKAIEKLAKRELRKLISRNNINVERTSKLFQELNRYETPAHKPRQILLPLRSPP